MVYHSSSLAGQIAAVESGIAVAVLTRCSVPPGLVVLGEKQGLPPLSTMEVAVLRSNLAIIDKAIADSRAALEKDPGSRALSSSLDRALESKLALMRRVSLL